MDDVKNKIKALHPELKDDSFVVKIDKEKLKKEGEKSGVSSDMIKNSFGLQYILTKE